MSYGVSNKRRAQAHAKRKHTCSRCGKVVFGNGYANHRKMHARRGEHSKQNVPGAAAVERLGE